MSVAIFWANRFSLDLVEAHCIEMRLCARSFATQNRRQESRIEAAAEHDAGFVHIDDALIHRLFDQSFRFVE